MIYKADARFKIREEDHNGQTAFAVWFEDRKLIAFETRPYPDYQNGRAKANAFMINCCIHNYANNKKMQAMTGEHLEELFHEIERREVDYWQHRDEVAQYFDNACNIFANYGIKIDDYDKLDKFFEEEE